MPTTIDWQQLSFFVILTAAFVLLLTERIRNDLVALLIILALAITRVLEPEEAVAGFSSEPAIIVASVFVMSGAFHATALDEMIGNWIGRLAGTTFNRAIAVIMPAVALLSAFTHHVTTTAVMLPVTLNLARQRDIPASKLLMPLSFAASLGTTITIIGAPAFLVASETLEQAGHPALGVFSIAPIGLTISAVGTLFVLLAGRFLLPEYPPGQDVTSHFRIERYYTEVKILPNSPFLNRTLAQIKANGHYRFTVVGWMREGQRLRGPYATYTVQEGDVLLVHTTPEDMLAFRQEPGLDLHAVDKFGATPSGDGHEGDAADQLVQAVLAPDSDLIGRTLREIDFRQRYGPVVVGLWRRGGFMREELARVPLAAGDVLVLQGDEASLGRVRQDRAFLMLVPFHGKVRLRRKARVAGLIMLSTILLAAFNILTLEIATLAGAVAMVLTRCVTMRQAYRAIDVRVYVFIAGAIPLGVAMQESGAAAVLATWFHGVVQNWSPTLILLAIFWIVAIATQLMSDAGTTALFAPVAVALAQGLGHNPGAYVVTVAMAAVAAFLTPIGHHGNLLIYGPGRYRFADFVRVGTPLTILVAVLVVWLAQLLWPL